MTTSSDLTIRPELPADHASIAGLVERAFESPAEARLVEAIRSSPEYLADLSLVAVRDGTIVGHVMISGCRVDTADGAVLAVMLSPLAVEPSDQRRGIGSALVGAVTSRAAQLGHPFVVLEGDPRYYARFGFVPAARTHDLHLPLPDWAPPEAGQVLVLDSNAAPPAGTVVYPASFDSLEEQPDP